MSQPILIFDMDGVLVDVTETYRETIARTVEHFTAVPITHAEIQDYKNQGGFNDDWQLTAPRSSRSAASSVPFEEVKEHFQKLFLGNGGGRPDSARALDARPGLLDGLAGVSAWPFSPAARARS